MRILMITAYPEGAVYGGVEAVASTLVPALSRRPEVEQIDVLTLGYGRGYGRTGWTTRPLEKGTHYRITSADRFELLTGASGDVERTRELCRRLQPDLIHAQGLHKESWISIQLGLPSLATIHGMIHIERRLRNAQPGPKEKLRSLLADRLMNRVLKHTTLLISTSQYDQKTLESRIRRPVVYIPNPVLPDFFTTPSKEEGQIVLFTGVLQPRKNVVGIVRAFAQVARQAPHARLHLVGPAQSDIYLNQIKEEIRACGLEDRAFLLGHISHAQLLAEYARASLVVLFSQEETSPMAIAQAIAMGKPVVAANVGGVSEMVLDGDTGYLVMREDENLLASRLAELISNSELRHAMGARARDLARQRAHPEFVAARTVEAYRQAIALSEIERERGAKFQMQGARP